MVNLIPSGNVTVRSPQDSQTKNKNIAAEKLCEVSNAILKHQAIALDQQSHTKGVKRVLEIRRSIWYEYGEKSNKYFLNLENSRKKKSCIRKLGTENDKSTTNPTEILNEIQLFYANLCDKKVDHSDENLIEPFLSTVNTSN